MVYGALWISPIQQKIKDIALKEVMKITGNRMEIGKLKFRPFNKLTLENVYVADLKGDTLVYAKDLSASFDLFKIFDDQLLITGISLDDFLINVNQDSLGGEFNFQFLIDAFASDTEKEESESVLAIQIKDIVLNKGRVNYDILSEPRLDSIFDFNHIALRDIQASMDINSLDMEALDISLNRFALKEQSGFSLDKIGAKLKSEGKIISLKKLEFNLPQSQITIPEARIDYTGGSMEQIMELASYSLELGNCYINPADIRMFYPPIAGLKDQLRFSGNVSGKLPKIDVSSLNISYGKGLALDASALLEDFTHWDKSRFRIELHQLILSSEGMAELLPFIMEGDEAELPVNTGDISLSGSISGTLSDLNIRAEAFTERGSFLLDGLGGYDLTSGAAHFDAELNTDQFDLETLLQDTTLGLASLDIKAKGNMNGNGRIDADAEMNIARLDFNGYTYNNVYGTAGYRGDTVSLFVDSRDDNLPIRLTANANIGSLNPSAQLSLAMDSVFIDTLNFLPAYKDTYLSMRLNADVKGFDPEKMKLTFGIDSFCLTTDKGSFTEPKLRVNYLANTDSKKAINISSRLIDGQFNGMFTYTGLQESLMGAFPILFEGYKSNPRKLDSFAQNFDFKIALQEANSLGSLLEIETEIPDSALFIGKYTNKEGNLELLMSAYTQFFESDTLQLSMLASNRDNNLSLILNVDNKSKFYDVDGSIDTEIEFIPVRGSIPDMNIALNPSVFVVNDTYFDLHEAQFKVRENLYSVSGFTLDHGEDEYIKIDGVVSKQPEDSIKIQFNKFEIGTLLGAMKTTDIPISGNANGEIVGRRLLTTPVILTRNLGINDIIFADNEVGDINLKTAFITERKAIGLRATLDHRDREQSVINGYYLMDKDSLSFTASIRDIQIAWLQEMMKETLYGLDGTINADIKANGKTSNPQLEGAVYFDKAQLGVKMLNVKYHATDTIHITPNEVRFNRFSLYDENNRTLRVNGGIKHQAFSKFTPNLTLMANNFQVMNNAHQVDSLFFGNMRINGRLNIREVNKEWLLSGNISHADKSKIMINMPTSASTAQRHTSITFVNSEGEDLDALAKEEERATVGEFSFPMRMNISITLDQGLTMGAIYNPASGDFAEVNGSGLITFSYDLTSSMMGLTGDYTVNEGKASLSIANITTKTFLVQKGGKVTFKGDPLATSFDVTALYNLRADLATLDEGFSSVMGSTRVPIQCSVSASGNLEDMDKMDIKYNLILPNESEEITRRLDGILYTDDQKIMQIAYLLALGSFMPSDMNDMFNTAGGSMTGSIASIGLNALLSSMFSDNWSINTNIDTNEAGVSDMDVSVSTSLLDNRLTVTGTVGYMNQTNSLRTNNYTGDFMVEYKLVPSGTLSLKAYHETNYDYFSTAPYTQGIGIVYKRGEKTFKELFQNILGKKNPQSGRQEYRQPDRRPPEETEKKEKTPNKEGNSNEKNNPEQDEK
ncbi:translocation/assembly module TamB domain-containing protein [Bacteroidales bacterium OttesenSCG-928-J19]|nr:translocation/assembly module TamB domain-containing protein [Bacteroidales bacterium OttesenSCG-928-J19]